MKGITMTLPDKLPAVFYFSWGGAEGLIDGTCKKKEKGVEIRGSYLIPGPVPMADATGFFDGFLPWGFTGIDAFAGELAALVRQKVGYGSERELRNEILESIKAGKAAETGLERLTAQLGAGKALLLRPMDLEKEWEGRMALTVRVRKNGYELKGSIFREHGAPIEKSTFVPAGAFADADKFGGSTAMLDQAMPGPLPGMTLPQVHPAVLARQMAYQALLAYDRAFASSGEAPRGAKK